MCPTPALIRNVHKRHAADWAGFGFGTTQERQNVIRVFLSHLDIEAEGGD
jgi:hypothetical protein